MPYANTNGIKLYYEIHGKGEPLVMIAGYTMNTAFWYKTMPVMSQKYQTIIFDNRGSGESDQPDLPYSIETMADDLAQLLDNIRIDSAHIMGHSMGGMIAQQFALRHPTMVRSLILASTSCGGIKAVSINNPEIPKFLQRMPSMTPREIVKEWFHRFWKTDFLNSNPGFVKEFTDKITNHPSLPAGLVRQLQAIVAHSTYEYLPQINTPTLVITGDADALIASKNSNLIASRIPGAELVWVKNAGHFFMFEAFAESNRILVDFLKRQQKTGRENSNALRKYQRHQTIL